MIFENIELFLKKEMFLFNENFYFFILYILINLF